MRQNQSFGTGDINLAAAITTMGVPPDPTGPVELIARDNGRDYTRFHFLAESYCGKYTPINSAALGRIRAASPPQTLSTRSAC
jgi:hypothetical protein